MSNKINIIYDITILGESSVSLTSRTGVFRVIENVLTVLIETGEHNILLYPGKLNYWECRRYLRDKKIPRHQVYMPRLVFIDLVFGRIINYLSSCVDRLSLGTGRLILRALRKMARLSHELYLAISAVWENPRKTKLFRGYDVYHTFIHPVPGLIARVPVKRFVTVFDIIPVLYPEYFNSGSNHPLRKVIGELGSDDYIFSISKATKNDLCRYNKRIDPDKVFVTHLAASNIFRPCTQADTIRQIKDKYGIPRDAKYVLSVATLEPRKNLVTLVKSFVDIVSSGDITDLYLVLVGVHGWQNEELFEKIGASAQYSGKIVLTGYVEDEDLSPLYSGALVFVYPSLYEGFGLPPLEAMQCGTPVITSNTSSLPEVVGDSGIMVDPHDDRSIGEAILAIYRNNDLKKDMSVKSIERAGLFSWQKTARETIHGYERALKA